MNYNKEIMVSTSPELLFLAITEQLELWWGKTDVSVTKIGDEFTTSFGNAFWKFRITEFIRNKKVAWECIDGQPEFENEWVGTKLSWNIESVGHQAKLSFTHDGLTPSFDCYDVCAPAWDMFIAASLKSFIETGKGRPHIT